ncbi:PCNA-interacting partner-like [Haliotis rubra]|uniref:PCNA-interacting partner-like n=1 Tax=Haliotis rubra TaxID=36100 RepID=UPI001EE54F86|nr:PCNA-interacting partner-like [Haliotis rubra]
MNEKAFTRGSSGLHCGVETFTMPCRLFIHQKAITSASSVEKYIRTQTDSAQENVQFISPACPNSVIPDVGKYPTVGEFVTRLCRSHGLLVSPRVTVLSMEESLQALQLCLASMNKEKGDSFDAEKSKVHDYYQKLSAAKLNPDEVLSSQTGVELLTQYNSFLAACGHVDIMDVVTAFNNELTKDPTDSELQRDLSTTTLVFLGVPRSQTEKLLMRQLCRGGDVTELYDDGTSEDTETISQRNRSLEELLPLVVETPVKGSRPTSASIQQVFTHRVLLAYLHVLVNSRSELALARIFNVPDRELDHHAFTALKHEAKRKKMSMFQTATSFLMRIRLGGKGYAPDTECPLNQHVKGLGDLTELVQKLLTVAEEVSDIRCACRRILNVVKNRLVKCKLLKLRKEDVEVVTEQLYDCISQIVDDIETRTAHTPDKPASEGGSLIGRRTLRVIKILLDKMASTQGGDNSCEMYLSDMALNPTTPTRVPCLMSQFRSPDIVAMEEDSPDKPDVTRLSDRDYEVQQRLNRLLAPSCVQTDFELAAIHAIEREFPSAEVKGCFLHYCQAIWRKVQDLGLAVAYREDLEISRWIDFGAAQRSRKRVYREMEHRLCRLKEQLNLGLKTPMQFLDAENSEVVLPCGEKLTRKQLNSVIVFPSKTVVHACPDTAQILLGMPPAKKRGTCAALDKENLCTKPPLKSDQPAKKRKICDKVSKNTKTTDDTLSQPTLSQPSLSQPTAARKKKAPASKKGCRRQLLPQVKGQQKLTGFFRV